MASQNNVQTLQDNVIVRADLCDLLMVNHYSSAKNLVQTQVGKMRLEGLRFLFRFRQFVQQQTASDRLLAFIRIPQPESVFEELIIEHIASGSLKKGVEPCESQAC